MTTTQKTLRKEIKRAARRAEGRTGDRALPRLTKRHRGIRHIIDDPPLVTRPSEHEHEQVAEALDDYLQTLPPQWSRVLGATASSTSCTRSSGSALSDCGPTSLSAKAAARTT